MVGILTATLILEERKPTAAEEAFLDVAENLNDLELRKIVEVVGRLEQTARDETGLVQFWDGELHCQVRALSVDTHDGHLTETGNVITTVFGTWGEKLRGFDLLYEQMHERHRAPREQPFGMQGMGRGPEKFVSRSVIFRREYKGLVDLINRADIEGKSKKND